MVSPVVKPEIENGLKTSAAVTVLPCLYACVVLKLVPVNAWALVGAVPVPWYRA